MEVGSRGSKVISLTSTDGGLEGAECETGGVVCEKSTS